MTKIKCECGCVIEEVTDAIPFLNYYHRHIVHKSFGRKCPSKCSKLKKGETCCCMEKTAKATISEWKRVQP